MDAATFREAMGRALPLRRYAELAPAFDAALRQAGCTTVNRAAMFCAQVGHESLGLKFMAEIWGPSAAQRRYEPPGSKARQLGNTQPGDGRRFKGQGALMVTGRGHFTQLSRWAHEHGYVPSPTYFVDRPAELGNDRFGFLGAVWYWTVERPRLNQLCDAGDITGATRAVNGGLNHIEDRTARWEACLRLGTRLLPTGDGHLTDPGPPDVDLGPPRRRRFMLLNG